MSWPSRRPLGVTWGRTRCRTRRRRLTRRADVRGSARDGVCRATEIRLDHVVAMVTAVDVQDSLRSAPVGESRIANRARRRPVTCGRAGGRSSPTTSARAVRHRPAGWAPRSHRTRETGREWNVPVTGPRADLGRRRPTDRQDERRVTPYLRRPSPCSAVSGGRVGAGPTRMDRAVPVRPGSYRRQPDPGSPRRGRTRPRSRTSRDDACGTGGREPRPRSWIRPMVPKTY